MTLIEYNLMSKLDIIKKLKKNTRNVYTNLFLINTEFGKCEWFYYGAKQIAENCGLSTKTFYKCRKELNAVGLLDIKRKYKKFNKRGYDDMRFVLPKEILINNKNLSERDRNILSSYCPVVEHICSAYSSGTY